MKACRPDVEYLSNCPKCQLANAGPPPSHRDYGDETMYAFDPKPGEIIRGAPGEVFWSTLAEMANCEAEKRRVLPAATVGKERLVDEMTSAERKASPVFSGVLNYFPDALAAVAALSKFGNDKHNPGEPLHWAREKSTDHKDCIVRHLIGAGTVDPDSGFLHDVGLAWRALANLQLAIEKARRSLPKSRE